MSLSRLLRSAFLLALCIPLFLTGWTSSMDLVRAALTRSPALPTKLRDAESELTAARDAGRAYFQDAKIRPEVLAVAPNLGAKSPVDDPARPAEKELIEAVGDHARLIAETTDFAALLTARNDTGMTPPTNPEYVRLLEERRKIVPVEAEIRQALSDQVPDRDKYDTLLATARESPAADQRSIVPPPPPAPSKGDVLILIPKTRALVEDKELCDKLTALQARFAKKDKLIGDGVWLVDSKRSKRWPDLGTVAADASTFEDMAWFEGLRAAIARYKEVVKEKAGADFRTLVVWRCNFNPDEDSNFGRVIQLDSEEKRSIKLYWIRNENEKSNKLTAWFGPVEKYQAPGEDALLGAAFNGFVNGR